MQHQLKRWETVASQHDNAETIIFSAENQPLPNQKDLIIDALFGIGLNKPVTGFYADVIRHINASDAYTIAIDTPSGLFADKSTPKNSEVVIADQTLSIQFMKTAYLLPENYPYYGDVKVVDIGMEAFCVPCLRMHTRARSGMGSWWLGAIGCRVQRSWRPQLPCAAASANLPYIR